MYDLSDRALWLLTIALTVALLVRLVRADLWWRHPFHAFTFMLLVGLVREVILWPVSYAGHAYAVAWEVSLFAVLVCQVWAGWSAYEALHERDSREFVAVIAAAVALCLLPLLFESEHVYGCETVLRSMLMLYRFVDGCLAVMLIASAMRQRRVPAHAWLLAGYFGAWSVVCLVKQMLPLRSPAADHLCSAAVAVLYCGWLVLLPSARDLCGTQSRRCV